jgi:large subunit ribosomal protein L35
VPKMKTRKSITSRFKFTATGKLKRSKAGKRHILTKKTSKRKRQLGKSSLVHQSMEKMYKRAMGVA